MAHGLKLMEQGSLVNSLPAIIPLLILLDFFLWRQINLSSYFYLLKYFMAPSQGSPTNFGMDFKRNTADIQFDYYTCFQLHK